MKNTLILVFLFLPFILSAQTDSLSILNKEISLEEVEVSSRRKNINITAPSMGVERLSIDEIRLMPALMGEVDILKAIQLLPGVQATAEGSSGFTVRGGSPDQNLIVLDNTTIYNPSHLMGFFSSFNNDVIEGIELYKGDFPFHHGGRLSSLLEVNTKKKVPDKFGGTGGIGLISSRLMLEAPLGEKTHAIIAGRRSYADLFLALSSEEDLKDASLYFYDLNGKITHRFSRRDKIELNFYTGKDKFGAKNVGDFNYGNTAASLVWNHLFSTNTFANFSVNYSNYDYAMGSYLEGSEVKWNSAIDDWTVRADFRSIINDLWNLSYGVNSTAHAFSPGQIKMKDLPTYEISPKDALEHAAYISNEQKLFKALTLKYGLRFSIFQNTGNTKHTYTALEPGISAVYQLNESSSLKAAFAHNVQYLQLANNSASGSPLDVWFSATSKVKPQKANLYSVGYFKNLKDNEYETSVELYYKDLRDVIDFKEHAELLLNEDLEDEVRAGKGKSYGIELMVRKNTGRLTGFINYTLSRTERTIPEVNNGKTFLAPYDKTHSVNVVGNYKINKKWNVSTTWVFATGTPTTYPTGRFEINGEYFPIYSGRNEYRKPDYHRMDLSVNYVPNPDSKKRWKGEWNFSLYNVYNQKNPWVIQFDQNKTTGTPYAEMMYLFGIVPSITYNFKF